jgi:hypothetical protein
MTDLLQGPVQKGFQLDDHGLLEVDRDFDLFENPIIVLLVIGVLEVTHS